MNIALIPARGGSKRIPRKNIKEFQGKPIIAYSIEAALKSGSFDQVIVSTDDEEIAEIARVFGAEVPFIRPKELADDFATTMDVLLHAVEALNLNDKDNLMCIYATSPLLSDGIIKDMMAKHVGSDVDYTVTVTSFPYPVQRALRVTNNRVSMQHPELLDTRSQDLEELYHDAGQAYACKVSSILSGKKFFVDSNCHPFELPTYLVQDIDTPDDWVRAEFMYRAIYG